MSYQIFRQCTFALEEHQLTQFFFNFKGDPCAAPFVITELYGTSSIEGDHPRGPKLRLLYR